MMGYSYCLHRLSIVQTCFSCHNSVPEITCPMPLSEDGIITVSWSYVHTGGLPLTALSVMYSYVDHQTTFTNPVPISDVSSLSATVSGLVVGFMYTFSVTAENSMGSSTTTRASVLHEIGKQSLHVGMAFCILFMNSKELWILFSVLCVFDL